MVNSHTVPVGFDAPLRRTVAEESSPEESVLVKGDCRDYLPCLESESVHLVVTDPPYFLDGLDADWTKGRESSTRGTGSVGGLPVGMKFDPQQGKNLQAFIQTVGELMMPALCPGAFAVVFSQPRLAHRLAVGLEDTGFEIRDLLAWHFTRRAQFKAFSMDHFIERMGISHIEKQQRKSQLRGRKTPQLRPQFEAMILAQKPKAGTFVENWLAYETGLMDVSSTLDGKSPATLMKVEKPRRDTDNSHLTVKPLKLLEHLIRLFSTPGQVVLDPFLGSGSTAVAALRTGRTYIGMEINPDYIEISERRLKMEKQNGRYPPKTTRSDGNVPS